MRDKHPSVAFTCSQTRRKLKPRHVPTCNLSLCGARPITAPFPGGAELQGRLRPGGRGSGPGETCWSQRRVKTLALHRASETPSPCLSLIGEEWKVKKWRGGTVQRKACLLLPSPRAGGRARANVGAGVGGQVCRERAGRGNQGSRFSKCEVRKAAKHFKGARFEKADQSRTQC